MNSTRRDLMTCKEPSLAAPITSMALPFPGPCLLSQFSLLVELFFRTEKWPISCQGKKPQLATLHVTQRLAINKQKELPRGCSP